MGGDAETGCAESRSKMVTVMQCGLDVASNPWGVAIRTLPDDDRLTLAFAIGRGVMSLGLLAMVAVTVGLTNQRIGGNGAFSTTAP